MTAHNHLTDIKTWKVTITTLKEFVPTLEEVLYSLDYEHYPTVSSFEIIGNEKYWTVEGFFNNKPDGDILVSEITRTAQIFEIDAPIAEIELLDNKNWVAESQILLKPITAGKFFLYGQHDFKNIPQDKISIHVEAGEAFGTGSHETTQGCLLLLSKLYDEISPLNILDLGCGSGVLAIAAAKLWNTKIIALDIDPIATNTAKDNIIQNDIQLLDDDERENDNGIICLTSDGFDNPIMAGHSPYDLIIANILAKPLQFLAKDITNNLKDNAILILSGLLDVQENNVLEAYKAQGWELRDRQIINEWHSLLLKKSIKKMRL
jgi:ribosomal protein L11 methyltransferase